MTDVETPVQTSSSMPSSGESQVPTPAFHVMMKPRGAICNLDCTYCYFLSKENLYPDSKFRMSDELLEEYTRQYIGHSKLTVGI